MVFSPPRAARRTGLVPTEKPPFLSNDIIPRGFEIIMKASPLPRGRSRRAWRWGFRPPPRSIRGPQSLVGACRVNNIANDFGGQDYRSRWTRHGRGRLCASGVLHRPCEPGEARSAQQGHGAAWRWGRLQGHVCHHSVGSLRFVWPAGHALPIAHCTEIIVARR